MDRYKYRSKMKASSCMLWLLASPVLAFLLLFGLPLMVFRSEVNYASSEFDQLSDQILNELPPPDGVELDHLDRFGTTGRLLVAYYNLHGENTGSIDDYYDHLLNKNGWKIYPEHNFYYRKFSCVRFSYMASSTYEIEIWHDFWKQPFSPGPVPFWWKLGPFNKNELGIGEWSYGEGSIYHCPESNYGFTIFYFP
jgi:hypothetical protein